MIDKTVFIHLKIAILMLLLGWQRGSSVRSLPGKQEALSLNPSSAKQTKNLFYLLSILSKAKYFCLYHISFLSIL
jgi:hypothetical protein